MTETKLKPDCKTTTVVIKCLNVKATTHRRHAEPSQPRKSLTG